MSWKRRMMSAAVASGLVAVATTSCGEPETFERKKMLEDTIDQTVVPTHETLGERADTLQSSVETFCDSEQTGEQLSAARTAWRELQTPLKHIQAWSFNMSPYRGASFETPVYQIDREPADGDEIESILDDEGTTIDDQYIADQDYTRSAKGFSAVEYLLFASGEEAETISRYKGNDTAAERRCDYLVAATDHAHGITEGYVEAWSRDGGDFAGLFDSRSPESMDWTTIQDSINAMVSQMVFVTKTRISKNLLGGPLGQHTDNSHVPDTVSSPYADASLEQMKATLAGLEKLYRGADGTSLADYAKFRKQSVHELVVERLEAAKTAIDEIPAPLEEAVDNDTEKVQAAQTAVDELTSTIEADLKTTLGATTTKVIVDSD